MPSACHLRPEGDSERVNDLLPFGRVLLPAQQPGIPERLRAAQAVIQRLEECLLELAGRESTEDLPGGNGGRDGLPSLDERPNGQHHANDSD